MIHELGKHYGWSKSQINEVYPNEATILLKFIAFEKKDKLLQHKIDYYTRCLDGLYVQHGEPDQQRNRFTEILEKLQLMHISIISPNLENSSNTIHDDELPDLDKLNRLKEFQKSRAKQ